jgi:hypothetical protein
MEVVIVVKMFRNITVSAGGPDRQSNQAHLAETRAALCDLKKVVCGFGVAQKVTLANNGILRRSDSIEDISLRRLMRFLQQKLSPELAVRVSLQN